VIGFHYKMRARSMADTAYVSWIVEDAADSAGIHAPELIFPGSATVVAVWTDDVILQTAVIETFAIALTSAPTVAPDPGTDISYVLVDTTAWTPNDAIQLPASPLSGGRVSVKDQTGSADTRPIVVSGNGKLIQGQVSDTLSAPFVSRTYLYRGVEWSIV